MKVVKSCPACRYFMFQGKDFYDCEVNDKLCDDIDKCFVKDLVESIKRYKQYLNTEIDINYDLSTRLHKIKKLIESNDNYFTDDILDILNNKDNCNE